MAPGDICGGTTLAALGDRGSGHRRDVASGTVQPVAAGELWPVPEALLEWVLGMWSHSGGLAETYPGLRLVALELLASPGPRWCTTISFTPTGSVEPGPPSKSPALFLTRSWSL